MPTYQYACTNAECGNRFDLVQKFTDPAADSCPVCGSPVRKVFSSVGVVFKGSGFYRNDSREGANRSGAESKSDSADRAAKAPKDGAAGKDSAGSSDTGSSKGGGSKDGAAAGSSAGSSANGSSAGSASPKPSAAKSGASS